MAPVASAIMAMPSWQCHVPSFLYLLSTIISLPSSPTSWIIIFLPPYISLSFFHPQRAMSSLHSKQLYSYNRAVYIHVRVYEWQHFRLAAMISSRKSNKKSYIHVYMWLSFSPLIFCFYPKVIIVGLLRRDFQGLASLLTSVLWSCFSGIWSQGGRKTYERGIKFLSWFNCFSFC